MARDVADHLKLDRVLWIPAGAPPHKPATAVSPAGIRLEMVREAVRSDPRFEASTLEVDRAGPSYTVDTVKELRDAHPGAELFLILGADQVRDFPHWRDPDQIVRYARLAVMDRDGASAARLVRGVPGGERAVLVPVRRVDVSSSAVREAVRAGESPGDRVPPGIAAIIERQRLYSAS